MSPCDSFMLIEYEWHHLESSPKPKMDKSWVRSMKLLYITSLSGKRINGFMRSAIIASQKLGIDFHMACNMDMADKEGYKQDCKDYGITVYHIPFERNPLSVKNLKAFRALDSLIREEHFDIIHCNTPIGGLLGRLAAKRNKEFPVIYMAHGFHFWKGAPLKNWLLYYPVERILSRYTDILITINQEDFNQAKKFRLRKNGLLTIIHGVGVDLERFSSTGVANVRKELGISEADLVYISVGELIPRKNQITLLKAFKNANIPNSHLLICGDGELRSSLEEWVYSNSIDNIHLLGFRSDVPELLMSSNVFVFPSLQEGLPGALMEAMASGKSCVASRIRGNVDLLGEDYKYLFDPNNIDDLSKMLKEVINDQGRCESLSKERIQMYDFKSVVKEFISMYNSSVKMISAKNDRGN